MAENRGNLTSYRPDIKVMDCTLRDGGLVNNFEFTDEFVKDLYEANVAAGVDYMEFGYKADKDIFMLLPCLYRLKVESVLLHSVS